MFSFIEHHFGSLLNSDAANRIIETKIDLALARPQGMYNIIHASLASQVFPIMYVYLNFMPTFRFYTEHDGT